MWDKVEPFCPEEGLEMHRKMLLLRFDVFPVAFFQSLEIFVSGVDKAAVRLASLRKIKAPFPRLRPERFDRTFRLLTGDAIALPSDHAVDALAVHHDVDRIADIVVGQALGGDAMFIDPLANL